MADNDQNKKKTFIDSCEGIYSNKPKYTKLIESLDLWHCQNKEVCSEGIFDNIIETILEKEIVVEHPDTFVLRLAKQRAIRRIGKCSACNQKKYYSIDVEDFTEPKELRRNAMPQPNHFNPTVLRVILEILARLDDEQRDLFKKRFIQRLSFAKIAENKGEITGETGNGEKIRVVNKYVRRAERLMQKIRESLVLHPEITCNPNLKSAVEKLLDCLNPSPYKN